MQTIKTTSMRLLSFALISVGIFSLLLVLRFLSPSTIASASVQAFAPTYSLFIGPEEYLSGPRADYPDAAFFGIKTNGEYVAYTSNNTTYRMVGTNLNNIKVSGIALKKGTPGYFDGCGSWLISVDKLSEKKLIGWYHAEGPECDHKKLAYTESNDGGLTWTKPNYPNNIIISPDVRYKNNVNTYSTGDGHVVKKDGYYYMFYLATGPDWHFEVARSKVTDKGKPGTWNKYYCSSTTNCGFTQPGIGGRATAIENESTAVIYSAILKKYISLDLSGKWGFYLHEAESDNLTIWSNPTQIFPEVSDYNDNTVDDWTSRDNESKELLAYGSLIGVDGNSQVLNSNEFYIYYLKLFPREGFDKRYAMRRKVSIILNSTSDFSSNIALSLYKKTDNSKMRVSTQITKPEEHYIFQNIVGYISGNKNVNMTAIYECYVHRNNDYILSVDNANITKTNYTHCEHPTDTYIRKLGWISTVKNSIASIPLYRCWDQTLGSHFASTDTSCGGKRNEKLLGYIEPKR